jgi:hypothetical protein
MQLSRFSLMYLVSGRIEMSQQASDRDGGHDEITRGDVESAFRVLEYLRDEWSEYPQTETLMNGAHSALQAFSASRDLDSDTPETAIAIAEVPQEAVDYAFDRLEATTVSELLRGYQFSLGGNLSYDYDGNRVVVEGRTPIEQIIIEAVDEKLHDMLYEVNHGERDDYTAADLKQIRRGVQTTLTRHHQ